MICWSRAFQAVSDPLQVGDDRGQVGEEAVAADPGDGRLEGVGSLVQLGDLVAPLASGARLELGQVVPDLLEGGHSPLLAGLGRVELVELGQRRLDAAASAQANTAVVALAAVVAGAALGVVAPDPPQAAAARQTGRAAGASPGRGRAWCPQCLRSVLPGSTRQLTSVPVQPAGPVRRQDRASSRRRRSRRRSVALPLRAMAAS